MLVIIDYGLGNLNAFKNIFSLLNIDFLIADNPSILDKASHLILPGVGSFDFAMNSLNNSGMRSSLDKLVLNYEIPILGVCVGMQMMAHSSEEGSEDGLGWVDASVRSLKPSSPYTNISAPQFRYPHMGWNSISVLKPSPLFTDLQNFYFYFLHNYYFYNNSNSDCIASTIYNINFTSVIGSSNIYGVQFHPEKSHQSGVSLLRNFAFL